MLIQTKFASTNRYNKEEFLETPDREEVHRLAKLMPNCRLNTKTRLKIEPREIHAEEDAKEVPRDGEGGKRRITEEDHRKPHEIASESP
jgi:hypothetical protein